MSIPKAKRLLGQLFRSRKPEKQSRRTATTRTVSARSKKTASKVSPAPAKIPVCPDCLRRATEPLNQVLIADIESPLVSGAIGARSWQLWMTQNLIISTDYKRNVFHVLKNRWGPSEKGIPLDLLATFLYNPEVTDARELNMLRIEHNNLFAYTGSEQ